MKGLLIALLLAGCSVGAYPLEDSDAPPIKLPTGETSAGCNGLTEAGTCDAGVAKYCDVANDYITQVDCRALG
ncbi:hypothetical protein, partial [Haliangium sp.]|uniref:hypothetical protein n=1 Tax=Haliangium sp. TaxID=2663208 RepID=UPI003D13F753